MAASLGKGHFRIYLLYLKTACLGKKMQKLIFSEADRKILPRAVALSLANT